MLQLIVFISFDWFSPFLFSKSSFIKNLETLSFSEIEASPSEKDELFDCSIFVEISFLKFSIRVSSF